MITVFHNNEIWDVYEDHTGARNDDIPLYALAYSSDIQ